jgi:hypothetical protein
MKGKGQKLLMKYDGPFEIIQKISAVAYRLRMPESYGIHPVIDISHLEQYYDSPEKFGNRIFKKLNRKDFEDLPEYEVEQIIDEKWVRAGNGRRKQMFRVRFKDYPANYDEWLTKKNLKNAPKILREWELRSRPRKSNDRSRFLH